MTSNSALADLAHYLGEAKKEGRGWRCICPAHDDRNPSLSIAVSESGKLLVKCWNGCNGKDVLRQIHDPMLSVAAISSNAVKQVPAQSIQWVLDLWESAQPIKTGDLAHRYLSARGISLEAPVSTSLRFQKNCRVTSANSKYDSLPALLARFDDADGNFSTIHRIYLQEPGHKAAIDRPKRIASSPAKGGAIRLFPPTNQLGIAEGIETALACYLDTGVPTWAAYSSSMLPLIRIPKSVAQVIIFGDNDRSGTGQKAASALHNRLLSEGFRVRTLIPPVAGRDWLDIFNDDQL